jgi:uncharacterized membrane protein
VRRFRIVNHLLSSLWFIPVLCVLGGVGLSFGTIALDRGGSRSLLPQSLTGDPDAALAVLTTVAASMVTLTGLVLTITMVVVQLATGQYTPRVLRTILRDRPSQFAIGVFVGTFAHAMLVMREVKHPSPQDPRGVVPGLAILVAFFLILVCIIVLVSYVNHVGQSLRAASLIDSVGDDTRERLLELYPVDLPEEPAGSPPAGDPTQVVSATGPGVLFRIGADELVKLAQNEDVVIVLRVRLGDFVPSDAPLADVHGGRVEEKALRRLLVFGKDRTLHDDIAYGIRLLVDVAVRAVAPTTGDPTTAVQAVDRIHDCLRLLSTRAFPSGRHFDGEGRLRLVVRTLSWEGYVHIALDELRHWSMESIQVTRRLAALLEDVLSVAPEDRRPPLREQLHLLRANVEESYRRRGADESAWAVEPDQQGVGSGRSRILQDERSLVP